MAIIAVAGVAGVLIGGGISSGIVADNALVAKRLLNHEKVAVEGTNFLKAGDHISYEGNHAIVEHIGQHKDAYMIDIIYASGSGSSTTIQRHAVQLKQYFERNQVLRHNYNDVVSYTSDQVVTRALYLLRDFETTLSDLVPTIVDGEDFANWCHIGMTFSIMIKGAWLVKESHYVTKLENMRDIQIGDHVSFPAAPDRYHFIVTNLSDDKEQTETLKDVSDIGGACRAVQLVPKSYEEFIRAGQLKRHNYDISVRSRTLRVVYSNLALFKNSEHLATSSTLGKMMTSHIDAAMVGRARVLGRLRLEIKPDSSMVLKNGDHLAWETNIVEWNKPNYHHVIVKDVSPSQDIIQVIHFKGSWGRCHDLVRQKKDVEIIVVEIKNVKKMISKGKLFRYHYNNATSFPDNIVLERAEGELHKTGYDTNFNNCEHFATWCKAEEKYWDFVI